MNANIDHKEKILWDFYQNGKYQEALTWLNEHQADLKQADFFYNVGVFKSKLSQLGESRYFFELAGKKGFNPSWVQNNIEVIKKGSGLESVEQGSSLSEKMILGTLNTPMDYFITFTLVGLLAGVILHRYLKKAWISVLVACAVLLPFMIKFAIMNSVTSAVALSEISLYSGPSTIFEVMGKVPEGLKIYVGEQREEWIFISYPEEFSGWVAKKNLGML